MDNKWRFKRARIRGKWFGFGGCSVCSGIIDQVNNDIAWNAMQQTWVLYPCQAYIQYTVIGEINATDLLKLQMRVDWLPHYFKNIYLCALRAHVTHSETREDSWIPQSCCERFQFYLTIERNGYVIQVFQEVVFSYKQRS